MSKIVTTYEIYEDGIAIGKTTDEELIDKIKFIFEKDDPEAYIENEDGSMAFSIPSEWLDFSPYEEDDET